jgi:hypothetical protein
MLLANVPAVGASSPDNIKDDAAGLLAGRRCMCTCRSHNGHMCGSNRLVLWAGSSAHNAVLAPFVGVGAREEEEEEAIVGGCVVVGLCIFVIFGDTSHRLAKNRTILHL